MFSGYPFSAASFGVASLAVAATGNGAGVVLTLSAPAATAAGRAQASGAGVTLALLASLAASAAADWLPHPGPALETAAANAPPTAPRGHPASPNTKAAIRLIGLVTD